MNCNRKYAQGMFGNCIRRPNGLCGNKIALHLRISISYIIVVPRNFTAILYVPRPMFEQMTNVNVINLKDGYKTILRYNNNNIGNNSHIELTLG